MKTPDTLLIVQLAIGMLFAVSALEKMRHPVQFFRGLSEYRILPEFLLTPAGVVLIVLEGVIAISHLNGWMLPLSSGLCLMLLCLFLIAVLAALRRKVPVSCVCFGSGRNEWISTRSVVRLVLLIVAEMALIFGVALGPARQMPHQLEATDLLAANVCALVALVLTSWAMAIPELKAVMKLCLTCAFRVRP